MTAIAYTGKPPYDAVIYTHLRTYGNSGYDKMAERMANWSPSNPAFSASNRPVTTSASPSLTGLI